MIDVWLPDSFSSDLRTALSEESGLIRAYFEEERRLMDEHLRSNPYQSLKPNPLYSKFLAFQEHGIAPLLLRDRIRVWHYTRLTDDEAEEIERALIPSNLKFLSLRLAKLAARAEITEREAEAIFAASPFQSQSDSRAERLWTTVIPIPPSDADVRPLLDSWGGESAYFWLKDEALAAKLRRVGRPRIIEIETSISDELSAFRVAETVLRAWGRNLGQPVSIEGCDLALTDEIASARVHMVHTEGGQYFLDVGESYPEGAGAYLTGPDAR